MIFEPIMLLINLSFDTFDIFDTFPSEHINQIALAQDSQDVFVAPHAHKLITAWCHVSKLGP